MKEKETKKMSAMDMEKQHYQMEIPMKECMKMEKGMVKELIGIGHSLKGIHKSISRTFVNS